MVLPTGKNLSIIISLSSYSIHASWMAFASWYSLSTHLPEATFFIARKKSLINPFYFKWTYKANIKRINTSISFSDLAMKNVLIVKDRVMLLRDWNPQESGSIQEDHVVFITEKSKEPSLCCSSHTNNVAPFVYLSDEGKLSYSKWENKPPPFYYVKEKVLASCNEQLILKCWLNCKYFYTLMST